MRAVLLIAIAALAVVPARAQPAPGPSMPFAEAAPPPPLTPNDMPGYCVYDNRVYSLGSGLCLGRNAYVCVPTPGPSSGNRAYWTLKDDPTYARPACM